MITLKTHDFQLPLRHVFSISRESTSVQPTLIVELTDGVHRGFGEATTNKYYGATLDLMRASLDSVRSIVESAEPLDPENLWEQTWPLLQTNPFAQCALDQAATDLWGKQQGSPVYKLWGLSTDRVPQSNFTIGIDTVEVMVQKLLEMPGWPIYKIKLGTKYDMDIVRELRKHTDAVFRVDANCGWNADQAIAYSHELAELNVEFIEQPLPADQWGEVKRVYEKSALPIIADESCICEADVQRCVGHFHGVNVKLTKCGGLTPGRRMVINARQHGLKTMVGCMTESTVGISAIAQLLPLLDYVDMDGAALLASDVATGVVVDRGTCIYPAVNGTGAQLIEA
ncbi:dipeptide epimerase [Lacipirellula limnantheis]|uniref:Dipeptide epimerase n=1 Tax=Lacipirellula limnantheis TaxID=2528024 RepID=A0A517U3H6_9BACT|nr:dipeptide epimerase [Lacipirellula limnantheis]QDT75175.1 L-Ala-D/L-Glu epimerase [Lacipirellula limnantheis]